MSELRKDPVLGRWVIIATERARRPGHFEVLGDEPKSSAFCPFCRGNEDKTPPEIYAVRDSDSSGDGGEWHVRVVPNKFPALGIEGDIGKEGVGMYDKMNGIGAHEVVIETPDHNKKLEMHTVESLSIVLESYRHRLTDLRKDKRFRYILIFKNEGYQAGASLGHPHSQIIATPVTPKRVKEELAGSMEYYQYRDRCVFCDIIREERAQKERVIMENESFISFCPFASRFPFEIWVLPKQHLADFHEMPEEDVPQLADVMIVTMKKLARALNRPQYNYVLHTGPVRWPRMGYWVTIDLDYHWHIEIMPRVTRVAGFEWGTGFYINPTPPEDAARFLQEVEI